MKKIKWIVFSVCCFTLSFSIYSADKKRFPEGCYDVGHSFKNYVMLLTPTAKYHPQTIYLVHNLANFPVNVRQIHAGGNPYIIHVNTTIRGKYWAVLAMDHKKMKFICTVNEKGLSIEQIIDCSKVLDICEYPYTKFGDNHRGNYWVLQSSSGKSAKVSTRYHGVLMIDPKKVKLDAKKGSNS